MIGFSAKHYEYVFVKCRADLDRDYSPWGTFVNRLCFVICTGTLVLDVITLAKIIYISKFTAARMNKNFERDVRFFAQTSLQNVTMVIALFLVMKVNNSSFILTSITNASVLGFTLGFKNLFRLALIFFNPEVRKRYGIRLPFTTVSAEGSSNLSVVKA
ncbi:hypothetical protein L596_019796 [Steinernema carpocapsae]|uniref:7TM GPCR serpentine receptor class x (Srx) domain-containing protein n=1 Tax=Steinernema carpocapsae TaxID=34508 RepID=A0A4U5MRL5_STECR|nr:hypothetical protein L596_019796 [Steinernema carpocapsae]